MNTLLFVLAVLSLAGVIVLITSIMRKRLRLAIVMKALLLILFFSLHCPDLSAQKKYVTVKAGDSIMNVLSASDIFYYPTFTKGNVIRKDGTKAEVQLNYNLLFDEIQFIGPRGDTLALANELTIKYTAIGKDTFFFNDGGYARIITNGGRAKLALKQVWLFSDSRLIGAYNTSNSSTSMSSVTSYIEEGKLSSMTVNADLVLKKIEQYYIGNNSNHFVLANKKNVLMLFPEWSSVEIYLKENKIDFTKEKDLTKLTLYLAQAN